MRYIIREKTYELEEAFRDCDLVVVDTETTGLNAYKGDRVFGLALYFPDVDNSFFVVANMPVYRWCIKQLSKKQTIMFNAKFDLHMLYADGLNLERDPADVLIMAHLANENEFLSNGNQKAGAYKLKRLAAKYLGEEAVQDEKVLFDAGKRHGINAKGTMHQLFEVEPDIVAAYAMADVEITWQLYQYYMPIIIEWGLLKLFYKKCAVQFFAVFQMEKNGMKVDRDEIVRQQSDILPRLEQLTLDMQTYLIQRGWNSSVNFASPAQLMHVFRFLGHDLTSTAHVVLAGLTSEPLAKMLLEFRLLSKANSTYYSPYLEHLCPDGCIHHSLLPTGTVTGRMASINPNFQQIPRTEDKGAGAYKVKAVFVPSPGKILVSSDYKAMEMRIGVHYANQADLREVLNDPEGDPHQLTADKMGISRQAAKTLNFGLLYGMGPVKASFKYGWPIDLASEYVYGWHSTYPEFKKAYYFAQELARKRRNTEGTGFGPYQYIRIPGGRVRRYHEYPKDDTPFSTAWNFMVQGTCANILDNTLLTIARGPYNSRIKLVNAIHDSIMYEIDPDDAMELIGYVEEIMCDHPYNPRLTVETEYTLTNWKDMKKYRGYIE